MKKQRKQENKDNYKFTCDKCGRKLKSSTTKARHEESCKGIIQEQPKQEQTQEQTTQNKVFELKPNQEQIKQESKTMENEKENYECEQCGAELKEGQLYCASCGVKLEW